MNAKISVFVICVKVIIYLLKYNLHDCTFNKEFMQNHDKDSDKGYILVVDVNYSKELHRPHSDIPLLPEIMKIDYFEKLVCSMHDKRNYAIHIRVMK